MTTISDEYMRQMLSQTRQYCVVILRATPKRREIWYGTQDDLIRDGGWMTKLGL